MTMPHIVLYIHVLIKLILTNKNNYVDLFESCIHPLKYMYREHASTVCTSAIVVLSLHGNYIAQFSYASQ